MSGCVALVGTHAMFVCTRYTCVYKLAFFDEVTSLLYFRVYYIHAILLLICSLERECDATHVIIMSIL